MNFGFLRAAAAIVAAGVLSGCVANAGDAAEEPGEASSAITSTWQSVNPAGGTPIPTSAFYAYPFSGYSGGGYLCRFTDSAGQHAGHVANNTCYWGYEGFEYSSTVFEVYVPQSSQNVAWMYRPGTSVPLGAVSAGSETKYGNVYVCRAIGFPGDTTRSLPGKLVNGVCYVSWYGDEYGTSNYDTLIEATGLGTVTLQYFLDGTTNTWAILMRGHATDGNEQDIQISVDGGPTITFSTWGEQLRAGDYIWAEQVSAPSPVRGYGLATVSVTDTLHHSTFTGTSVVFAQP